MMIYICIYIIYTHRVRSFMYNVTKRAQFYFQQGYSICINTKSLTVTAKERQNITSEETGKNYLMQVTYYVDLVK